MAATSVLQSPPKPPTAAPLPVALLQAALPPTKAIQPQGATPITALAPASANGPTDLAVPSYIKSTSEGFENAGSEGLRFPMMILTQPLSPGVAQGLIGAGSVSYTLDPNTALFSKDEHVNLVPFFHYKEWIEWDVDRTKGMIDRTLNPKSELAARAYRQELNAKGQLSVTEYHVFFVLFEGNLDEPLALVLGRTKHKKGTLLLSLALRRGSKFPLFAGKYELGVLLETNKKGFSYFNFDVKNAGWADESEYVAAEAWYQKVKGLYESTRLNIEQLEAIDLDEAAAPAAPGATPDSEAPF